MIPPPVDLVRLFKRGKYRPTDKQSPKWMLVPFMEGVQWAARQPVHVSVVCVHCCNGDGELHRVGRWAKAHTDCLARQLRDAVDVLVAGGRKKQ